MKQVPQGSGRVTISGSVIKMSGCGTSQYGLVGMVAGQSCDDLGCQDVKILEVFSNCNDSVILLNAASAIVNGKMPSHHY